MAVLDQLTLSNATPKRDTSPAARFRRRLISAIDIQIAMAEAEAQGIEFRPKRNRWIKNEASVMELREVPLRVRRWWWSDDGGIVYVSLLSGRRPLEVAPGKTAIEVGAVAGLAAKLAILRDAVRAGELDGCMIEVPRPAGKKAEKAAEKSPKKAPRRPEDPHREVVA